MLFRTPAVRANSVTSTSLDSGFAHRETNLGKELIGVELAKEYQR